MSEIISQLALAFRNNEKTLYLVGGTVRDELLNRGEGHDIDCTTNARPDEIQRIVATTSPTRIIPIGEKFGTIQVHYGDQIIEITTYRSERYQTGSRHPEVQFGNNLIEDLRRRDFTINAIAQDPLTGEIIDPFGGQEDITKRLICAVEDPDQRFREDPLRMLRAIRFEQQLDFMPEGQTLLALSRQSDKLVLISQERIRDEFKKMIVNTCPNLTINALIDSHLMRFIIPEIADLIGVDQSPHHSLDAYQHTLLVLRNVPPRLPLRMSALLHDIAKPKTRTLDERGLAHFYKHEEVGSEMTREILSRLKFSKDFVEYVASIVKLHMRVNSYTPTWSHAATRRLYVDTRPYNR